MSPLLAQVIILALFVLVAYGIGNLVGKIQQQELWRPHMEKSSRYKFAVDDLDKWCGHDSPHARLIARHLAAHGEGLGYNAGTPHEDEPCSISGLRNQLARLDVRIAAATPKDRHEQ